MPQITITRRFEFDYGHRVLGHEGKCASLHGHRGVAELTVRGPSLDDLGRVIDFGVLKSVIGAWIDNNWDHTMLLHEDDPLLTMCHSIDPSYTVFGPRAPFVMPDKMNPTAENMALVLLSKSRLLLLSQKQIEPISVRMWETPKCYSDAVES